MKYSTNDLSRARVEFNFPVSCARSKFLGVIGLTRSICRLSPFLAARRASGDGVPWRVAADQEDM
ncbi:hypothetical protein [Mesomycoplasma ovipneumoniae]|uniref:hypothetical protein n=1 Tax=Mesomycoplasma ovipneumoniae TaxID=29562 RepID=UPI0011807952|nr:hypothetical protein [Mesomycoplasma ovipneumoniae]